MHCILVFLYVLLTLSVIVEIYHLEKGRIVEEGSVQLLEQGPLRAALLVEKRISDTSRLRQIVVITAISRRIDFETEVDWNENRQFLVRDSNDAIHMDQMLILCA